MVNNILIVEDQECTLQNLEIAINKVMPRINPGFVKGSYDIAKWYSQARGMIENNTYSLVVLDHRMPVENPGCTDDSDFDRFASQLENIGYGLIPMIKARNPKVIIVGTSSQNSRELGQLPKPDFSVDKTDLFPLMENLEKILRENGGLK